MRLAYLAPAMLGLFLIGCGADEPEEVTTPPAAEQPQTPVAPPVAPPADDNAATGTMPGDTETGPLGGDKEIDQPVSEGNSPPTDEMRDPQTGGTNQ